MGIKEVILESFSEGGWVRYNKTIARELGVEAAIALGNIIDKNEYFGDVFYLLRDDIEFETALSEYQQRKAEKILKDKNLITITPVPQPNGSRLNYYCVDYDKVAEYLVANVKTLRDKKEAKKEFYRQCVSEVARLNNSMWPGGKNEPGQVEKLRCNKNKFNKNKFNKNFNNIPSIACSDEPKCNEKVDSLENESAKNLNFPALDYKSSASVNTVPALEFEDEPESIFDADLPVEAPARIDNVKRFIEYHASIRNSLNLPPAKYDGHIDRIVDVPDSVITAYLDSSGYLMQKFFDYCDDRSYEMQVRYYECNSDRSPSVMVNESVFRRFMDWMNRE